MPPTCQTQSYIPVFIITWVVARLTFFLNPAHDILAAVCFLSLHFLDTVSDVAAVAAYP